LIIRRSDIRPIPTRLISEERLHPRRVTVARTAAGRT
jgi:hypothetical protein